MKKLLFTVAAAAVISGPALAEPYLRVGAGANWLNDASNSGAALDVESDFDRGYAMSGALGFKVRENVRIEGEASYRKNDADSLQITNIGSLAGLTASASGDVTAWSGMINAHYDFNQLNAPFSPYIMGGAGFANVDADVSSGNVQLVDDDDTVMAWQVGFGAGYKISEIATLDLGYRYFATQDPELTDAAGNSFDSEYDSHSVLASVRFSF